EPYTVVAGTPAKKIKDIDEKTKKTLLRNCLYEKKEPRVGSFFSY
ncbi:hypothetical protein MOE62_17455, partial [Bacillus inaquosorum]|nr:hypothetical protein [Bacillus inaquosorum]